MNMCTRYKNRRNWIVHLFHIQYHNHSFTYTYPSCFSYIFFFKCIERVSVCMVRFTRCCMIIVWNNKELKSSTQYRNTYIYALLHKTNLIRYKSALIYANIRVCFYYFHSICCTGNKNAIRSTNNNKNKVWCPNHFPSSAERWCDSWVQKLFLPIPLIRQRGWSLRPKVRRVLVSSYSYCKRTIQILTNIFIIIIFIILKTFDNYHIIRTKNWRTSMDGSGRISLKMKPMRGS